MTLVVNGNSVSARDGATAREVLQTAGFSSEHHLALEMPDGTLMHLDDNEVIKSSPGDKYVAVPAAKKGPATPISD